MRKKLLSLLTVLCLVLGMLPATAMAAAVDAYNSNDVALLVTEDTEITEDQDGLVLVDAPCAVTVKDAKLSLGIVVSPAAAGASVTLAGATEANEVVVLSESSVKVEETAKVADVTVDAPKASVEVAGTVENVKVTENAAETAVTVTETAKVETVAVAAPAAAVAVQGAVKTVAVAETAAAAAVTVAETATVSALEVAAPNVKAEVAGTVESVAVAETATGAELVVAGTATVTAVTDKTGELTVSGDGAANVEVTTDTTPAEGEETGDDETQSDETGDSSVSAGNVVQTPPTETVPVPNIIWAPQHDNKSASPIPDGDLSKNGNVTVSGAEYINGEDGAVRATITISADDVQSHQNAQGADGYWVGFGIKVPNDTISGTGAERKSSYTYYVFSSEGNNVKNDKGAVVTASKRLYEVGQDTYNTIYFDVGSGGDAYNGAKVVVTDGDAGAQLTLNSILNSANLLYVFDIETDITIKETPEVSGLEEEEDGEDDESQDESLPKGDDADNGGNGDQSNPPAADDGKTEGNPVTTESDAPAAE